jgi:predicted transcriptional regulator
MSDATFTFRVDEFLKKEFTKAAKGRDRCGAQLDSWFRREVQVGLDAAYAGDVVSAEEVEAEANAWRAETRRKIAGADS